MGEQAKDVPEMLVRVGQSEQRAMVHGSWWRGPQATFLPAKVNLREADAIDRYVVAGWAPPAPFITRKTAITAFGSCFAQNVSRYLKQRDYNVLGAELGLNTHLVRFGEGMVNTFVILQQFEWALENKALPDNLWVDKQKTVIPIDPAVQAETKAMIQATEAFVITLGLTEIWYDKRSGEPLWRAIHPKDYDDAVHGFRASTFQENFDNLCRIYALIRRERPDAPIIFTLSPVPLVATFRPVSCITASSVSKATLRCALDEMIRQCPDDAKLHYFPSYEIVKDVCIDPYEDDNRHPKAAVIAQIMQTFERHYCVAGA